MARFLCLALLLTGCVPLADRGFMDPRPDLARADVPISVCALDYVGDGSSARAIVGDAIKVINDRVGFGTPLDVGQMRDPGGDARFNAHEHSGIRCHVSAASTIGSSEVIGYVVQHELGHCLGLDHDEWSGSIMRPRQRAAGDLEWPPRLTDRDRARLRETYEP